MARKKYFTPRDIDQLIPRLEQIFEHIDDCRKRAEVTASAMPLPNIKATAQDVAAAYRLRAHVEFLMLAVQDDVDYITSLGGITKDVETGLVDFPAHVNGDEVWLCWKRGERKVRFWHALDEGFPQRQTLHRGGVSTVYH